MKSLIMKSSTILIFLVLQLFLPHEALSGDFPVLQNIKFVQEIGAQNTILEFDRAIENKSFEIEYINSTIQVNIPGVLYQKGKNYQKVVDPLVESIYTYQTALGSIRSRIILKKNIKAEDYKQITKVEANGKSLIISLSEKNSASLHSPTTPPHGIIEPQEIVNANIEEEMSDQFKISSDSQEVENSKDHSQKISQQEKLREKNENEILSEAKIPVLSQSLGRSKKKDMSNQWFLGLSVSFIVLAIVLAGFFYWWSKHKHVPNKNTKIKILTQHYLGPKKSLAIIQVAGESLLIGITDHNISMIKSLSLLDEEIPEIGHNNFKNTLKDQEIKENDEEAIDQFAIKEIRDIVQNRFKKMKDN